MGAGPSASGAFECWARTRTTNRYATVATWTLGDPVPLPIGDALGAFKREVHAFALGRDHADAKALYLYRGRWRLVKAEVTLSPPDDDGLVRRTLDVTWYSTLVRDTYLATAERLANSTRWPLCGAPFARTMQRQEDAAAAAATTLVARYEPR